MSRTLPTRCSSRQTHHIAKTTRAIREGPRPHRRPPGTLPHHAAYLHQRTADRIGSLARLIRQAAIAAICDGTERITKKTLAAIHLDQLAEEARRPRTRTRQPSTTA
ncbi:hypothetical protein [Streptomyces sp. NPDC002172]